MVLMTPSTVVAQRHCFFLLISHFFAQYTLILQMGNPAPRSGKKMRTEQHHDVVNPAAGMGAKSSIDYRFDCSIQHQIRDGAYPLHMAVESNGSFQVIDMLVKEAGEVVAKTNKYGETALHIALRTSASPDVIALLIRTSPAALHVREKKGGNLPVHYAASYGCQSLVVAKALLENWADSILERNNEHLTPSEIALKHGNCSEDVLRFFERTAESESML